jgi:uncharacterized protein Yka (UPF0111/DUF47 family)
MVPEGKQAILEALDQGEVLLPKRVHEALEANARIKYYLSLLQLGCAHADMPEAAPVELSAERTRLGVDEPELDEILSETRREPDEQYRVPHLGALISHLDEDLERMLAPIAFADEQAAGDWRDKVRSMRTQEARLVHGERLSTEALAWLTSADPANDGPHRLCLDLHKAIDELQARVSTEVLDGAHVAGLDDRDRTLVAAFMRGLHRTERLKLGHPGLGTTATRSDSRLMVENDIGATDAHVVVVTIEGKTAFITTADVHVQRLAFFQRCLSAFCVEWQDTRSRRAPALSKDEFFLCSGTFEAKDDDELRLFLEHLGSRLVFLIDWNKARKALQAFVPKSAAVPLLDWASAESVGHRGFLEMGGDRFVYDVMAAVMHTPLRFGERLEDSIGVEPATEFLELVLRESADGLLEGRSRSLIHERVRAELASAFAAAGERLVEPLSRHAAIVQELAALVGKLSCLGGSTAPQDAAADAKGREHQADEVVVEVRNLVERIPEERAFHEVVEDADDAADEIEEAIFAVTLLPDSLPGQVVEPLKSLAGVVERAASAWRTCVDSSRAARRGGAVADLAPFLDAVDRVVTLERAADDAERLAAAAIVGGPPSDARVMLVAMRITEHLEAATDALLHGALTLRDHVFGAEPAGGG